MVVKENKSSYELNYEYSLIPTDTSHTVLSLVIQLPWEDSVLFWDCENKEWKSAT